ncbi:MAG: DinB family protein [Pirellulaceae bacterium]
MTESTTHPEPTGLASSRLDVARRHIESARRYTQTLLEDLTEDEWFWSPEPPVTHIAWQVGHLAFAQYGLVLFRQRGRLADDAQLMSGKFRKTFGKGTTPSADRSLYPSRQEIRETFDRIYSQSLAEMVTYDDAALDDPVDEPYAAFATRYGALLFAGDHEMLHAGQIGLLRRLMGKPPVR